MSATNVKISGHGSVAGGVYEKVTVSGSGRVTSALECDSLRISGTVVCDGPVKARDIRVSGSADFLGAVETESAVVSGASSFRTGLQAGKLKISGSVEVGETLTGGWVEVHGGLKVGRDCEVERFTAVGGFDIGGLLSADTIDVRMHAACKASEIGGESIEFREARGPLLEIAAALGLLGKKGLEAGSVEGDHVLLERAKVGTVRGRDVELGTGCDVDLVEYIAELKQASGARVKSARKTETAQEPQS
jgi:cytoskeletal protein CcmA (bactofilin family)